MSRLVKIILALLGGLIALLAALVAGSAMLFNRQVASEIDAMFAKVQDARPTVVTEADLAGLPEPVQRWLRYSQVVGKERVVAVRLKQSGSFRTAADQPWMPLQAEEYYTVDPPAFIWKAKIQAAPLVAITGRDRYEDGHGHMLIKLMSLVPIADARGPELDQGTLLRYLNEIMWFPSAALSDAITWEAVEGNPDAAQATMSYGDITASAIFTFDAEGRLTNMTTDRYRETSGSYTLDPWSTPITAYGEFDGVRIPVEGVGMWNLSDGDLSYIQVKIDAIEYNQPARYR